MHPYFKQKSYSMLPAAVDGQQGR